MNSGYLEDEMDSLIRQIQEYELLNGEDEISLSARAGLQYTIGEYATARDLLLKALRNDKNNESVLDDLGTVYLQLGDYAKFVLYKGRSGTELGEETFVSSVQQKIYYTVKKQKKHTFIILAIAPFSKIKQRYQNMSVSLVELGHRVIYINPSIASGSEKSISLAEALNEVLRHSSVIEGVEVYQPYYTQSMDTYERLANLLIEKNKDSIVLASYYKSYPVLANIKGKNKIIYDCADDNSDFINAYWSTEDSYRQELRCMDLADAILTSSISLFMREYLIKGHRNVYLSRNAVSADELGLGVDPELPSDLSCIPEPRIGYIGMIYQRFDRELFYELAEKNPDKSFVIIGGVLNGWVQGKYPNIYILGPKVHEDLYKYYSYMNLCIIPYSDTAKMSMACDPVKLYEQIICNVPTITTHMPDAGIDKPITYLASNYREFQMQMDLILNEKPSLSDEELITFITENSWVERAAQIIRIVEERNEEYDNPKYVLENIREKVSIKKKMHPNFLVLYGLTFWKENPEKCGKIIESACRQMRTDYNQELLKLFKKSEHMYDIFENTKRNASDFLEIQWLITFWCNHACSYCHMSHDRKTGHAFDREKPEIWADYFEKIKIPFYLNITGGEALLDIKNFTVFYNRVIDNPNLLKIRIDTNCTMPVELLKGMNIKKTVLMVSFHPEYQDISETMKRVKEYEKLGFEISMVNFVCRGHQVEQYKQAEKQFKEQDIQLAASIYFGEDANFNNRTINAYTEIMDKKDIGFKTIFNTKQLRCAASSHFISLNPQGILSNCFGDEGDLFNCSFQITTENLPCPMSNCNCIEKYSMLEVSGRDISRSLEEYIDTYGNRKRTRIALIIGYFGDNNFGDELLLDTLLSKLKNIPDVFPVVAAFQNPENVSRSHGVVSINLQDLQKVAQAACLCDFAILGPGGLLEDYGTLDPIDYFNGRGMYSYLKAVELAVMNEKPVYAVGIGAEPFENSETKRIVGRIMNEVSYVAVRDHYSESVLLECGLKAINVIPDMAFCYPLPSGGEKQKTCGINLRCWQGGNMEYVTTQVVIASIFMLRNGWKIKYLVLQKEYDYPLVKQMVNILRNCLNEAEQRLMENVEVTIPETVRQAIKEISSLSVMVAMRLHANLIAARYGIPSVFYAYEEKVTQAAKLLNMDSYILDPNSADAKLLTEKIVELIKNHRMVSQSLVTISKELSEKSEHGWDVLKSIIEKL